MARTPAPKQTNYPTFSGKAAIALVEEHVRLTAEKKAAESRLKVLKADLIALSGGAPTFYVGARTVSVTDFAAVPEAPARKITREMVGQEIPAKPGKAGYQQLAVR